MSTSPSRRPRPLRRRAEPQRQPEQLLAQVYALFCPQPQRVTGRGCPQGPLAHTTPTRRESLA